MQSEYPPVGFHFRVRFFGFGKAIDQQYQQVTGLSAEVELEEVTEGGENRFKHKLPKRSKYGELTLKRGFMTASQVFAWCRKATEQLDIDPMDLQIALLDAKHLPLATWTVVNAYPVNWSITDLNAAEGCV
ncbi:MAG: phage tail protein, partial [Bacteroidota bacterium]